MRLNVLRLAGPALLLAFVLPGLHADGVEPQPQVRGGRAASPIAIKATGFAVSQAARDLPRPSTPAPSEDRDRQRVRVIPNREMPKAGRPAHPEDGLDLARQTILAEPRMPGALLSFDGLNNSDNAAAFGFRVSPPDTNGDVGPSHYVQQTNLLVRVFNKAGTPLTSPFKLSSLFAPLGGLCAADDGGDPIVLYDPLADRWLLSQFAFTSTSTPPYHECVAVSQTSNPAGAYYLYDFITPGNNFPDYPKLGVWPDAYYMTTVQFLFGSSFNGTGAFAFERVKMLAGDPSASLIYFDLGLASHPEGIGGLLPADLDGQSAPPAGAPNPMAYFTATEFGDPSDALRLFSFHVDFASPSSSTFTERAASPLLVAAFNPISPAGDNDVPQPGVGTASFLDALSDRLMHRLQYRNRGAFESLVVTHTVDADTSAAYLAGIRYYELRNMSHGGAYFVNEQATFAPDTTHRWMGSAAVDHQGNLAVGYSVSSGSVFPGIRYAGRLATDAPGGLLQGEALLTAGSGVQTSTGSRWGDYSALTVDPADDCTFWFTTEYYSAASQASSSIGWLTRVGSFKFPDCTPRPSGTLTVNVTNCSGGDPIGNAVVHLNGLPYGTTSAAGSFSANLDPGSYSIIAAKVGVGSALATATVSAGSTTPASVCLAAAAETDLTVSSLSAPSKGGAGGNITVKYKVANQGFSSAGPTATRIYLSTDGSLDAADVVLGTDSTGPVAAGASIADSLAVTIPSGTAPAAYYLIAEADALDDEFEMNETNNTRSRRITIGPDLRVPALTVSAGSVAAGGSVSVTDTTKNVGGGSTLVPTSTTYYLSTDRVVSSGDAVLGVHAVPVLAPGASHSATTVVVIPPGTAPRTYYLIAAADAGNAVAEVRESNNRKVIQITVF